eukprot:5464346-Pyramimonas_sp.AAC.1
MDSSRVAPSLRKALSQRPKTFLSHRMTKSVRAAGGVQGAPSGGGAHARSGGGADGLQSDAGGAQRAAHEVTNSTKRRWRGLTHAFPHPS